MPQTSSRLRRRLCVVGWTIVGFCGAGVLWVVFLGAALAAMDALPLEFTGPYTYLLVNGVPVMAGVLVLVAGLRGMLPGTRALVSLPCPRCSYDLTGLKRGARCPECGFDRWDEIPRP